jgi:hypothetical protein
MFRFIPIVLLLAAFAATAQPKSEVREFTGIVTSFYPGFGLTYERMNMEVAGEEESFLFYPRYGKLILNKVRAGDQVSVRVKVAPVTSERVRNMPPKRQNDFKRNYIQAIRLDDRWVELPAPVAGDTTASGPRYRIFFDMPVIDTYEFRGHTMGIIFPNGLVAHSWYTPKNKIKKGDVLSFAGRRLPSSEGFQYPIPDVKEVYFTTMLLKEEGTIKSLVFKQNHVCVGLVAKTQKGEFNLAFPSNYAERISKLAMENRKVIFYFEDGASGRLNPPGLKALIHNGDTLKMEAYGISGPDIKHDHKPASIKGRITKVNKSDQGRIISLIIENDCYVEVDHTMEKQLGNFFRKGQVVEVSGDERIKEAGEIYSKDYRIIMPRALVIDGKNFLLGQQP